MEKKTVKAVTRKQKYLAAIAGDGVAPSPITSDEKLMYNIAEKTNEGGGSGGSSGGGVLVVHLGDGDALDKTWNEIDAADVAVVVYSGSADGEAWHSREFVAYTEMTNGNYFVNTVGSGGSAAYVTNSADGYPAIYNSDDDPGEMH